MGPRRISNGGSRWRSIAQLLWSFLASETSGGFYGLLASSFGQFSFGRVGTIRRHESPISTANCKMQITNLKFALCILQLVRVLALLLVAAWAGLKLARADEPAAKPTPPLQAEVGTRELLFSRDGKTLLSLATAAVGCGT